MTSLTSGLPSRDTCVQPRCELPADGDVLASVEARRRSCCSSPVRSARSGSAARSCGRRSRRRSPCRRPCCPVALAEAEEVEDRTDVAVEGVVTLAGEDRHAVLLDDRLVHEAPVVRESSAGRCCSAASCPRTRRPVVPPHRPLLDRVPRGRPGRPCGRSGTRRPVRLAVAVRVDVDLVLRVRRERVVVRAGRGILTRDPVRDDRHGVRLVRAPKRVQVRVVGARILRDQRRLTVTRSGTGARGGSDDCRSDCGE